MNVSQSWHLHYPEVLATTLATLSPLPFFRVCDPAVCWQAPLRVSFSTAISCHQNQHHIGYSYAIPILVASLKYSPLPGIQHTPIDSYDFTWSNLLLTSHGWFFSPNCLVLVFQPVNHRFHFSGFFIQNITRMTLIESLLPSKALWFRLLLSVLLTILFSKSPQYLINLWACNSFSCSYSKHLHNLLPQDSMLRSVAETSHFSYQFLLSFLLLW